jgi:hypothetical protein
MTVTRLSGGCHCGAVRFDVAVRQRVALTCNCSICKMKGFVHVIVPRADFRLLNGAGNLTTYTFNTHTAKHTFCRTCGVQAFYTPRSHPNGVSVNFNCLDAPVPDFEIQDFDGANWEVNIDQIR